MDWKQVKGTYSCSFVCVCVCVFRCVVLCLPGSFLPAAGRCVFTGVNEEEVSPFAL